MAEWVRCWTCDLKVWVSNPITDNFFCWQFFCNMTELRQTSVLVNPKWTACKSVQLLNVYDIVLLCYNQFWSCHCDLQLQQQVNVTNKHMQCRWFHSHIVIKPQMYANSVCQKQKPKSLIHTTAQQWRENTQKWSTMHTWWLFHHWCIMYTSVHPSLKYCKPQSQRSGFPVQ